MIISPPCIAIHNSSPCVFQVLNDILVLLRELCYGIPKLTFSLSSQDFIIFLFTCLSHSHFFDHAISLLEEILADQAQTFYIGLVADLGCLIRGFSCRQLAHFCRVLALLIFEPEDVRSSDRTAYMHAIYIIGERGEDQGHTYPI